MARSVRGLGANLLENAVYRRIFSVCGRKDGQINCDKFVAGESSEILRNTSRYIQTSAAVATPRITSSPRQPLPPSPCTQAGLYCTKHHGLHNLSVPHGLHVQPDHRGLHSVPIHHGMHRRPLHLSLPSLNTHNCLHGMNSLPLCHGIHSLPAHNGQHRIRTHHSLHNLPAHHDLPRPSAVQHRNNASFTNSSGAWVKMQENLATPPAGSTLHPSLAEEELHAPVNPLTMAEPDLRHLFIDIRKLLQCERPELQDIACYYFDGQGKVIRPIITVLVARAVNYTLMQQHRLLMSQLEIAKVTEMIHTASLLHDDVLDRADTRRGKPSVTRRYGQRRSVMAGDYILSVASTMLARLDCPDVTVLLAQVLADLVQGEFMQLGSRENENERFSHYLDKTFRKTASLIAYSCQAVGILGGADEALQQVCFQYGRNVGIAFQLVDDFLDFVASSSVVGKPTAVDLRLGVATAPVLFASQKFPELDPLISRRFSNPGDVQFALQCVRRSDGLEQTQRLAAQHCAAAIRAIQGLRDCTEKRALIAITDMVINRIR